MKTIGGASFNRLITTFLSPARENVLIRLNFAESLVGMNFFVDIVSAGVYTRNSRRNEVIFLLPLAPWAKKTSLGATGKQPAPAYYSRALGIITYRPLTQDIVSPRGVIVTSNQNMINRASLVRTTCALATSTRVPALRGEGGRCWFIS